MASRSSSKTTRDGDPQGPRRERERERERERVVTSIGTSIKLRPVKKKARKGVGEKKKQPALLRQKKERKKWWAKHRTRKSGESIERGVLC